MHKKITIWSLVITFFVSGCTQKMMTDAHQNDYHEDLSAYRPVYPALEDDTLKLSLPEKSESSTVVIPEHHITDTLNAVLDSISVLSQDIKFIDGYTVQIYSGNSREVANITSGKAHTLLESSNSTLKPLISYKAPNFKVQVGQFYNTIDAHTVHMQLMNAFPNTIIVLKKFRIKKVKDVAKE